MPIVSLMILCINKLHYQIGDKKNFVLKNKKTNLNFSTSIVMIFTDLLAILVSVIDSF